MTVGFEGKMNIEEARALFRQSVPPLDSEPKSDVSAQLRRNGIADVHVNLETDEYAQHHALYKLCIEEHPEWLQWTQGTFNAKGEPEDGHVRKEVDFNSAGMQTVDPKFVMHHNHALQQRFDADPRKKPAEFVEFMELGEHIKRQLFVSAKNNIELLDEEYPGLVDAVFPNGKDWGVTLRTVIYDPYKTRNDEGKLIVADGLEIAKEHFDRGTFTIQANTSAPGFWYQPYGKTGAKFERIVPQNYRTQPQLFAGAAFRSIFGSKNNPIKPLFHGVQRILPRDENGEIVDFVDERTVTIGFFNTPFIDTGVTSRDTQPHRTDAENLDI